MIHSRPKSSTILAISIFLTLVFAVDIWLLVGLIYDPTNYFIWKLLLVPGLFAIGVTVAVKSYFSAIKFSLGKDKLTYQYLLSSEKSYPLSDIAFWHEDVVKRKNTKYSQLTILLNNGKKLYLSNHESSNYAKIVNYLKKKVKRPK